jgi:hypothetical protein
MAKDITFRMRCKAFTGHGVKEYSIMVSDEDVLVFDDIAEHYTTCHTLCPAALAEAKRMAMEN